MDWKNATIKKKISIGMGFMILVITILVGYSYFGVSDIVSNAKEVIEGNKLDAAMTQREVDHLKWAKNLNAFLTDENGEQLKVELDHTKCALGKWLYGEERKKAEALIPDLSPLLSGMEEPHQRLHESARKISEIFYNVDDSLGKFLLAREVDHLTWAQAVSNAILNHEKDLNVILDPRQCAFGKWYYSNETAKIFGRYPELKTILAAVEGPHTDLHKSAEKIKTALNGGETATANGIFSSETIKRLSDVKKVLEKAVQWTSEAQEKERQSREIYSKETLPALGVVQEFLGRVKGAVKENLMTDEAMLKSARNIKSVSTVIGIVSVVAGILFAYFITVGIVRTLRNLMYVLTEGSTQVASASGQISQSSQALASGTTEQAAALEEISSTLEQTASMTNKNADNAGLASQLSTQSMEAAKNGNEAMTEVLEAMKEINESSGKISNIIKVIEEIAFQTNLLALNAAVEAARAGEAGKGFAVVAEEVRNLAQRSASAAKDTAGLIEESVQKAQRGNNTAEKAGALLQGIVENINRTAQLVREISTASKEQAHGVGQVNSGVSQLDTVTQQNAASAEELAASSEELSAQAENLKDIVENLGRIVGGSQIKTMPRETTKLLKAG